MGKIITAYTPVIAGEQSSNEIDECMLITEYIEKQGINLHGPYICIIDEKPISRKHWNSIVIGKHDVVLFLAFPQGGGGEGGSNPAQVVATIAVMAAALAVPGMIPFIAGHMFLSGLTSAVIMYGGTALINAAFPPESPDTVTDPETRHLTSSSYNINDRGNTSALNQIITVQYGRIKHYPKYAMQSWSEFINNEQYAYLLFCQGQGKYDFEEYNFGTVSSEELGDVTIETFQENQTVTTAGNAVVYDNVFTSEQVRDIECKRVESYFTPTPGGVFEVASEGDVYVGTADAYAPSIWGPTARYGNWIVGDYLAIDGFGERLVTGIVIDGINTGYVLNPAIMQAIEYLDVGDIVVNKHGPWEWDLTFINGSVPPIPFENGIRGNVLYYDGYVPGDNVKIYDGYYDYTWYRTIKSVYYYDESGEDFVAYEFVEGDPAVSGGLSPDASITFLPNDTANGYVVPNRNNIIQKGQVDIAFPNGVYRINDTTGEIESYAVEFYIQFKPIFSDGTEFSYWIDTTWDPIVVEGAFKSPVFKTYDINHAILASARKIRVRVSRQLGTPEEYADMQENTSSLMKFVGLKAFLPNTSNYGDVTIVSVKVKTTNSLVSTGLSKFNTVSTRVLPTYNGATWTDLPTRNPAWAMADACRNSEYSLGIPDEEIDLDALVSYSTAFANRADYCDGLFEAKEVFWDALKKISKVGRAQPLSIAGAIGFVRDEQKTVPKQVFTADNVVSESFSVEYLPFEDGTPNAVELEYFDEEEWIWKTQTGTVPGLGFDKPAKIKQWGITTADHALREAKWRAACNAYRRKFPSFTTELEGRILKRLDYISVSSPRVGWGISGHVTDVTGNILTLSQEVEFDTGSYYIAFTQTNGTQDGPYLVTEVPDEPKKISMSSTPPAWIYTEYEQDKTRFQFGQGELYDRKCLVQTVLPRQLETVQITCIVDDERVYTADGT